MKELEYYTPVTIPTLCRYDHFKRCIESLSKNTHADKTELIIGLDYPPSEKYLNGWQSIDRYINTIKGFRKVTVLRAKSNIGSIANSKQLREYALSKYDTYIYTEDDNEFSPCFLDYCHKGLSKYWDDPSVLAICGYTFPVDLTDYHANIFFHHDNSAWGIARWKHKNTYVETSYANKILSSPRKFLKLLHVDSRLLFLMISMITQQTRWGDALYGAKNVIENKVCLYPKQSLCRNHGHDGSGEHGGTARGINVYKEQSINYERLFHLDNIPVKSIKNTALDKYFHMPLLEKLSILKRYILFLFK